MRRLPMAMLFGSATLLITGCSAGRTISNPFASSNASLQPTGTETYAGNQYANEYENDPIGQVAQPNRVAIDPQPVPPARGISLTKQISLTTTTVGRRRRIDGCADGCTQPPSCVAPVQCAPQRYSASCKGRGLLGKLWPFHCHKKQPIACVPQQGCVAEPSCCIPQATCCVPEPVRIPHSRCVAPLPTGCAVEGCDQATHYHGNNHGRGLIGRLFCCLTKHCRRSSAGAYCSPGCSAPAHAGQGCCSEGCGNHAAMESIATPVIQEDVEQFTDGPIDGPSPMSESTEDPFAQPAVSPDQEPNAKTPVPSTPDQNMQEPLPPSPPVGKPLEATDVPAPPQPATTPLQPAAAEPQTWIEPSPWRRLDTASSHPVVIQPRSLHAQPSSWKRQ